jgi:hypothetical protein
MIYLVRYVKNWILKIVNMLLFGIIMLIYIHWDVDNDMESVSMFSFKSMIINGFKPRLHYIRHVRRPWPRRLENINNEHATINTKI